MSSGEDSTLASSIKLSPTVDIVIYHCVFWCKKCPWLEPLFGPTQTVSLPTRPVAIENSRPSTMNFLTAAKKSFINFLWKLRKSRIVSWFAVCKTDGRNFISIGVKKFIKYEDCHKLGVQ